MAVERQEGRVALITGAANGVGRATAKLFSERGYSVVAADVDGDRVAENVKKIGQSGGIAVSSATDVSDPEQVEAMVKLAIESYGRLDAAVNNAAVPQKLAFDGPNSSMLHEMSDQEWQRVLDINLTGVFYCLRSELRVMRERGQGGTIVNLSSSSAVLALEGMASYVASKKGVFGLTEVAALENGRHGIRVNTVIPGNVVGTKMFSETMGAGPEAERVFGANSPLERPSNPAEIGEAIFWLCSDASSYLTGTSLCVDGGTTVRHPSSRKRV
jgi:NAD(P)-dependent dehydrogenase (short-subunit alcohol dehydrogenase family)